MFILVDGDWGGNGYLAAFLIRFEKHIALFLKHYGHVHGGSLLSSSPEGCSMFYLVDCGVSFGTFSVCSAKQ